MDLDLTGAEGQTAADTSSQDAGTQDTGQQADTTPADDTIVDDAATADDATEGHEGEDEVDDAEQPIVDNEKQTEEPEAPEKPADPAKEQQVNEQLKPLQEIQAKVMELGGLPMLEMAQPVIDALYNPEATADEIFNALANAGSPHNAEDLAWGLLENEQNRQAMLDRFFPDKNLTPDILEKLVEKFAAGEVELEGVEDEDDDIWLTPQQKAQRAREQANAARDEARKQGEREAQETALKAQRDTAMTGIKTSCGSAVDAALKDAGLEIKADDTPEVQEYKQTIIMAVRAMVQLEFSRDPIAQRIDGLIKKNGFKAADTLTKGSLVHKIQTRATELAKKFSPAVTSTITKAQKEATKIKKTRQDPDGAMGQGEATKKKELTADNPNWRQELDAEYEAKFKTIAAGRHRDHQGRFL